jgi:hypothetical protein
MTLKVTATPESPEKKALSARVVRHLMGRAFENPAHPKRESTDFFEMVVAQDVFN